MAEVVDDGAEVNHILRVEDSEIRPEIGLEFIVGHVCYVPLPLSGLYAADLHAACCAVEVGVIGFDPESELEVWASEAPLVMPLLLPIPNRLGACVRSNVIASISRSPSPHPIPLDKLPVNLPP